MGSARISPGTRCGPEAVLGRPVGWRVGPTFRLSGEVGGPDGDAIVDRSLVEIKTTANAPSRRDNTEPLDRETLWQLAGYFLLDRDDRADLDEVAVCQSRWGRDDSEPTPRGLRAGARQHAASIASVT